MFQRRYVIVALAAVVMSILPVRAADDDAVQSAPVMARLYFRNGTSRPVVLIAQSSNMDAKPNARLRFRTATGEVAFNMDALVTISDIFDRDRPDESSALFRVDHGTPRRLRFGQGTEMLLIENQDGTRELVDLRKIARLQVLKKTAVANASN